MDWHFVNVDQSGLTCSTAKGIGGGIVLGKVCFLAKSSHLSSMIQRVRVRSVRELSFLSAAQSIGR